MKQFTAKLFETATDNPYKTACISGNESITYAELLHEAQKLVPQIKKESTPVLVYGHKELSMITKIFACLLAEKCYVPADISIPEERLKCIKKDIDSFQNFSDCAYIIFTSGTTGNPKGIAVKRESLQNFVQWINSISCLKKISSENPDLKILNTANFNFDLSIADIFYSLTNGHTLVTCPDFSIENFDRIFSVIDENKINIIIATPTFIKLLLTNRSFCQENFNFVNCLFLCGEMLEISLVKKILNRFPNLEIINAYGPTETVCAVSASIINAKNFESMVNSKFLPAGDLNKTSGEIIIRNEEIIIGGKPAEGFYINSDSENYFTCDGKHYYRTGDKGFISNGRLYVTGRNDRQIKYKGYRIELKDIEQNFRKLENIDECIAVAKKNSNGNVKYIKIFATVKDVSACIGPKEYILSLAKFLPPYMIPKDVCILENFPLTVNGKTDIKKLEEIA